MSLLWQQQGTGAEIVVNDFGPATSSRRSQLFTCQRYDAREGVPRTLHSAFASCVKSIGIADDTDTQEGVNHTEDLFWGSRSKRSPEGAEGGKNHRFSDRRRPLSCGEAKENARLGQTTIGPSVLSPSWRWVKSRLTGHRHFMHISSRPARPTGGIGRNGEYGSPTL